MKPKYRIEKCDEPFDSSRPEAVYAVTERHEKTDYYCTVYEAMLSEEEAKRAVEALKEADRKQLWDKDPDGVGDFLDSRIFTSPQAHNDD